ncbi:MAG: type I pullulanase [Bacillota bacterium]
MSLDKKMDLDFNYDNFYCDEDDLGVIAEDSSTSFKIWAPAANKVEVLIFEDENNKSIKDKFNLKKDENGCWTTFVSENLSGNYYLFIIDYGEFSYEVIDPYARAVGTNSKLGYIVDLSKTNPEGWENDKRVKLEKPTDAVIYEVHVKDFSSSSESGIELKGDYLAFTEKGTKNRYGFNTGIDHLKNLGITHVHLLPVFDFATVDDTWPDDYNWGYDPYYYNVPEGSYASDPSDETRIIEFKKMVKALHDEGIGVIMDVVYNHTYYTEESNFEKTAPGYFYRKHEDEHNLANGSGVGNEFATEKPMARKFIIDSLCYWAEEYHIDGFRFDLMRIIDKETMDKAEDELHEMDSSILLYGEPWSALPPQLHHDEQMLKGAQKKMNISAFNDHFRDAIKGDTDGNSKGFVNGKEGFSEGVKKGIVGGIYYNEEIHDFTVSPSETINYVSAHDNLTLWDKLKKTNGEDPRYIRIKMDKMAQAIIFTSLGVPFLYGGEEFLRTKFGNSNSYNAGDYINMLKWERKTRFHDTFKYYSGLIELRNSFEVFRMENAEKIRKNLEFLESSPNTIAYKLKSSKTDKKKEELVILYNPNREWRDFEIGEGRWGIIVDDKQAGNEVFNIFEDDYIKVPPISVMVLVSK